MLPHTQRPTRPQPIVLLVILLVFFNGRHTFPQDERPSSGNIVAISGAKGHWGIVLNGRSFELRGVGIGYARGRDGTDYLAMARAMGANAIRTWGIRQGTLEYLDAAYKHGLYVDAGIWLNPAHEDGTYSYIHDEAYKRQVREETLRYVKEHRHHPAILFWNIGNETIYWTKREEERVAFCRFLDDLVREVHAIDPHHPVIYTSAFTTAVDYVKRYIPSLDAIGLNIYGGLEEAHQEVVSQLNIPYVVSEFGPLGPWDRPKDVNGKPVDLTDVEKADYYEQYATLIERYRGYGLGGFAFYLGETTQVSLTWWNLNDRQHPRLSFLTLAQAYTGRPIQNKPPVVFDLAVNKQANLHPGEAFEIRVRYREPEGEAVTFHYAASTDRETSTLEEFPNQEVPLGVEGDGAVVTANAPTQPGIYRIYVVALDPHGLAGTLSATIHVKE